MTMRAGILPTASERSRRFVVRSTTTTAFVRCETTYARPRFRGAPKACFGTPRTSAPASPQAERKTWRRAIIGGPVFRRNVRRSFRGLVLIACVVAGMRAALAQEGPDFGSPPPGTIPILLNDRHVYAKPDQLRKGRVLAALVRGTTILVPLRSLFESIGATVRYEPQTRTAAISNVDTEVRVTVNWPRIRING